MARFENITALDVRDGDIIINAGYRCRVSGVRHIPDRDLISGEPTGITLARYTLHSEPSVTHPLPLPAGYSGGTYGGNHLLTVARELR